MKFFDWLKRRSEASPEAQAAEAKSQVQLERAEELKQVIQAETRKTREYRKNNGFVDMIADDLILTRGLRRK